MREAIVDYVKWAIGCFAYEEPVLDTCAGWEPNYYQPLFPGKRYIKQDMQDFYPPCIDVLCDITDMKPISDESIGLVLNLESLEHIPYPQKAIDEIHRVLRPDGLLILTTVMHFKIHHAPKDYWRFTPEGIELLLKRFNILDCTLEGDSKRPKGVWITARKTSFSEEWGKLPPLRVVKSDDRLTEKLRRRVKRLFKLEGKAFASLSSCLPAPVPTEGGAARRWGTSANIKRREVWENIPIGIFDNRPAIYRR